MKISLESNILLHSLHIREDKKHYIVEQPQTGEYFEMPRVCIEAINRINSGDPLKRVEEELIASYPKEEIDLIDFIEQLIKLGLVKEVDGEVIILNKKNSAPTGFMWVSSQFANILFNRFTIPIFFLLLLFNIIMFIKSPQLLPVYSDLFIFDAMVFNTLLYALIILIMLVFHECGHILAIRAHGLPANVQLSNRLFLIVAETDLTHAWKLPTKSRNLLFLAGMFIDQLILSLTLTLKLTNLSQNLIIDGILSLIILDLFIKTIYQCCIYMKTDLYYVLENVTSCYNLMENGKKKMSKWIPFISEDKHTTTFEGEEKIVKIYSVFYFISVGLTMIIIFFFFLPQLYYMLLTTVPHLTEPLNNPYFWDAIVIVGQTILFLVLLIYSIRKSKKSIE
ncbi:hypothetical protein [Gracilibacillus kekensis]|uniref:Peptide zinc metalloprotease protein n=1 Tax=Gracilibacillus kekensis TaxID=1027249 RepID=A0A1M7IGC7_9BACI|nr:hypothetical protein [Gracilibacillus kekensis]SHM39801.1 hypothetical protein SAMN05216179_0046 [Gracilibacillus kekensis]